MENCLVTKLKAVVNNDNLIRLGEVLIDESVGSTEWVFQKVNTASVVITPVAGTVRAGNTSAGKAVITEPFISSVDGTAVYVDVANGGKFTIGPSYYGLLLGTNIGALTAEVLNNLTSDSLKSFIFSVKDKASDIDVTQLSKLTIKCYMQNVNWDVQSVLPYIAAASHATDISISSFVKPLTFAQIGGVLSGSCTKLGLPKETESFSGTIESFVEAMCDRSTSPVTSGSLQISVKDIPNVTFDGNTLSTGLHTITWNGKTNITVS